MPAEYDSAVVLRGSIDGVRAGYLSPAYTVPSANYYKINNFIFLTKPVIVEYRECICRIWNPLHCLCRHRL